MSKIDVLDIELTVIKADGLAAKDTNLLGMRSSDPYVIVKLCPRGLDDTNSSKLLVGKTTIKMKTLSPHWDEKISFSFPKCDFGSDPMLELTIMDHDMLSEDDLMGVVPVRIPMDRPATTALTKWYRVPAGSAGVGEEATGRIQCSLRTESGSKTLEELREQQQLQSKERQTTINATEQAATTGKQETMANITLKIRRAEDLTAMDTNMFGKPTKSDPYIEVRLFPQGLDGTGDARQIWLGKTKTKIQTLNPVYNKTFSKSIPLHTLDPNKAVLELTLLDYDLTSEADLMGVVFIPIPVGKPTSTTTKWYDIPPSSGKGGNVTGRVSCTLTYSQGAAVGNTNTENDVSSRLQEALTAKTTNVSHSEDDNEEEELVADPSSLEASSSEMDASTLGSSSKMGLSSRYSQSCRRRISARRSSGFRNHHGSASARRESQRSDRASRRSTIVPEDGDTGTSSNTRTGSIRPLSPRLSPVRHSNTDGGRRSLLTRSLSSSVLETGSTHPQEQRTAPRRSKSGDRKVVRRSKSGDEKSPTSSRGKSADRKSSTRSKSGDLERRMSRQGPEKRLSRQSSSSKLKPSSTEVKKRSKSTEENSPKLRRAMTDGGQQRHHRTKPASTSRKLQKGALRRRSSSKPISPEPKSATTTTTAATWNRKRSSMKRSSSPSKLPPMQKMSGDASAFVSTTSGTSRPSTSCGPTTAALKDNQNTVIRW